MGSASPTKVNPRVVAAAFAGPTNRFHREGPLEPTPMETVGWTSEDRRRRRRLLDDSGGLTLVRACTTQSASSSSDSSSSSSSSLLLLLRAFGFLPRGMPVVATKSSSSTAMSSSTSTDEEEEAGCWRYGPSRCRCRELGTDVPVLGLVHVAQALELAQRHLIGLSRLRLLLSLGLPRAGGRPDTRGRSGAIQPTVAAPPRLVWRGRRQKCGGQQGEKLGQRWQVDGDDFCKQHQCHDNHAANPSLSEQESVQGIGWRWWSGSSSRRRCVVCCFRSIWWCGAAGGGF